MQLFKVFPLFFLSASAFAADKPTPDYTKQIAPILKKYCVSCHNPDDKDGELSLSTFQDILKGGRKGTVLMPGNSKTSRLVGVLNGTFKPKMPPRKNKPPTPEEITLLTQWIDSGAKGPSGAEPIQTTLNIPDLPTPKSIGKPITSLTWSRDGKYLFVARFLEVEMLNAKTLKVVRTFGNHPGKVNSVEVSADGQRLITGSGITGLYGHARIWEIRNGGIVRQINAHRDTLYAATLSPDEKILATSSYDKQIILTNAINGKELRTLNGHNGAVYDLAFSPNGKLLISAGADDTCKIWQVSTGERLDTLGQPLKEQYAAKFSPDGKLAVAGGVDNRIRVWKIISREKRQINPILYSRFAHEGAILDLEFTPDGKTLISVAEDRTIKLFDTKEFTQIHVFGKQPADIADVAVSPNGEQLAIGRMDGTLRIVPMPKTVVTQQTTNNKPPANVQVIDAPMMTQKEREPNNDPSKATVIKAPGTVTGVIYATNDDERDVDFFRFQAKAGQKWVLEINAARSKSPLDSRIQVLDKDGKPVLRTLMRAVRDSYITFRGINSSTRDCRVHNWQEMDLNQYLYLNGEIVRLHTAPRGPDSGFLFYPDEGSRRNYFGTSATSHPLHEPCYVVEPVAPGTELIPNGLPVFPIFYENDDDSLRKLGNDSRLIFTAPSDGEYLIRVTDVRGFQGEKYKYTLSVRPAKPSFKVTLSGANPTVNAGSGKEFSVKGDRIDGFDGPITVHIDNLPPGFEATSPIVIQPGHELAFGTINAIAEAPNPDPKIAKASVVTATAMINGKKIEHKVNNFGTIKLAKKPQILISLEATGDYLTKPGGTKSVGKLKIPTPQEWEIKPGETIAARVKIERNGFKGRVQFEALRQNLPHGVIIDNIGLNGLLIVEGTSERTFYLTANDWVPESTRTFYLRTSVAGQQTSWPIVLHVSRSRK